LSRSFRIPIRLNPTNQHWRTRFSHPSCLTLSTLNNLQGLYVPQHSFFSTPHNNFSKYVLQTAGFDGVYKHYFKSGNCSLTFQFYSCSPLSEHQSD
jgi:hypothetical protein